jgi:hypothetical protein
MVACVRVPALGGSHQRGDDLPFTILNQSDGGCDLAGELGGMVLKGSMRLRECKQVRDAGTDFDRVGGFGQEVGRAGLQGLAPQLALIETGDHDGRDVSELRNASDRPYKLHPVHARHVVVGDHDANLGRV